MKLEFYGLEALGSIVWRCNLLIVHSRRWNVPNKGLKLHYIRADPESSVPIQTSHQNTFLRSHSSKFMKNVTCQDIAFQNGKSLLRSKPMITIKVIENCSIRAQFGNNSVRQRYILLMMGEPNSALALL